MKKMYRYPGPSPFKEGMKDLYHGREEDVENLYNSVLLNGCTVIVGKSGIGKSSLINAGLIPLIEDNINNTPEDQRQFVIVRIRAGSYKQEGEETLLARFTQAVFTAFNKPVVNPFLSFLDDNLRQSVGFILKQWQYDAFLEKKKIAFLFIFDQLEEIFTYPFAQFKELEKEIKELLNPNIPDSIRYQLDALQDRRSSVSPQEAELLTIPIPVKFLFAIRADKLSLLIRLKEAIPNVLSNLYELRPMNKEQAERAITNPAVKTGNYEIEPFTFDREAVEFIIGYLMQLPDNDLDYNFETLKIDPITIQVICQYIEQKIAPEDEDKIIKKREIKDPDIIFTCYYEDTMERLNLSQEEVKQAKELIENKMIYEPDKRRRQLFLDECGIGAALMAILVNSGLLREVNSVGRKPYYELSHDWLVSYVLHAKRNRLEAEQQNKDERVPTLINNKRIPVENSYEGFKFLKEKAAEFFSAKNYHEALLNFELAAEVKGYLTQSIPPGDEVSLFYGRGECYFRLNQFEKSLTDLQHVLELEKDHRLASFYLAYDYHMLGKLDDAINIYERLLLIDPSFINAWFNSALIYNTLGNTEKAKGSFKKVIELDNNDADGWYNLGVISNNLKEFKEAVSNLSTAVNLRPDYTNAYIELAYAYSSQTPPDTTHALECYDAILKYDSSNANVYRSKATILNDLGKTAEAEICLLKATSFDGTDFTAPYKLGIMASNAGHYAEAVKFFEKVLQLKPDQKDALIEIGYANIQLNDFSSALKYYEQLLKLDPEDAATYRELGIIYDNLGKKELSIANFLEAIKRNEKNDLYYFDLAITYHKYNEIEKAKECFNKQIELSPLSQNVSKAYNYLGYYALESQDFNEALRCYNLALERKPDYADYLYNLGLTYNKMNRSEEALSFFERTVAKNPDDSDAHYYIGEILEKQNKIPEAISAFRRVLALKPDHADAMAKINMLSAGVNVP